MCKHEALLQRTSQIKEIKSTLHAGRDGRKYVVSNIGDAEMAISKIRAVLNNGGSESPLMGEMDRLRHLVDGYVQKLLDRLAAKVKAPKSDHVSEALRRRVDERLKEIAAKSSPTMGECCLLWHHGHLSAIPAKMIADVESAMRSRESSGDLSLRMGRTVSTSMPGIGWRCGKVRTHNRR